YSVSASNTHLHSFPTRRSSDLLIHPSSARQRQGNSDRFVFASRADLACLWRGKERSWDCGGRPRRGEGLGDCRVDGNREAAPGEDRKSTRLNSSHVSISYAVFC